MKLPGIFSFKKKGESNYDDKSYKKVLENALALGLIMESTQLSPHIDIQGSDNCILKKITGHYHSALGFTVLTIIDDVR